MRILFYFGHPSQYFFLRNSIKFLRARSIRCDILIKSKEVLESLLREDGEEYTNILPEGRNSGKMGIIWGLIKRDFRLLKFVIGKNYNLFIGTDPSISHVGYLMGKTVLTVLEDDIDVIRDLARITFPFTTCIVTPYGCSTGKYEYKTIHYSGYMKLAYLHPNYFIIKPARFKQPYYLIRLSKLDAYHDFGVNGFSVSLIKQLAVRLRSLGLVLISSEGTLDASLIEFELKINPSEMHQVLANAEMLISDSQSMSMEAAMLGVPSIRFNDFAGRISVLEELEHRYGLTFAISANEPEKLFEKVEYLVKMPNLKTNFSLRNRKMLSEKIDVTAFLVWFIENFPDSSVRMKESPEFQNSFAS